MPPAVRWQAVGAGRWEGVGGVAPLAGPPSPPLPPPPCGDFARLASRPVPLGQLDATVGDPRWTLTQGVAVPGERRTLNQAARAPVRQQWRAVARDHCHWTRWSCGEGGCGQAPPAAP